MTVVDARRMMNHLYVLDLRTLVWTLVVENGEGHGTGPTPRYFHSMEVWRDNLVLFGESHSLLSCRGRSQRLLSRTATRLGKRRPSDPTPGMSGH